MFIARAGLEEGKTLLVFGLSRENINRLTEGRFMDISRATHGMSMPEELNIIIFFEETEEIMRAKMAELVGPDTVIDQKRPI